MTAFLDERPKPVRSLSRFLTFALIAVIGISGLTARLFYLQIVDGGRLATLATRNRTVLEPIVAPRGVIYDRNGRPLVANVPTFVVKLRPADLPLAERPVVVDRLAALLRMPVPDINAAIDGNPGSTFDLVRIASDVDEMTARLIAEAGYELPGVEVVIEARRQYTDGPLLSQILGYTGPVSGEQLSELKNVGYLPDDLIGKAGIESVYESALRGVYGSESVERDAQGRRKQVLQTISGAQPGNSLTLTIDTKEQGYAQKALTWAMREVGMKRGVVIVMNPRPGRSWRWSASRRTTTTSSPTASTTPTTPKLLNNPDKPLLNHAIQAHYPPGSTYKLVAGTGVLADKKITDRTKVADAWLPDPRRDAVLRLEPSRLRTVRHLLRVRPLERHLLLPDGRKARGRSARLLGQAVRLRSPDRHRPARTRSRGSSPRTSGSSRRSGRRCSAARPTRRGSGRATTWSRRSS